MPQFTVGERAWTVDSIQDLKQDVTSVLMDITLQECPGMVANMLRRMDYVIGLNNRRTNLEH